MNFCTIFSFFEFHLYVLYMNEEECVCVFSSRFTEDFEISVNVAFNEVSKGFVFNNKVLNKSTNLSFLMLIISMSSVLFSSLKDVRNFIQSYSCKLSFVTHVHVSLESIIIIIIFIHLLPGHHSFLTLYSISHDAFLFILGCDWPVSLTPSPHSSVIMSELCVCSVCCSSWCSAIKQH